MDNPYPLKGEMEKIEAKRMFNLFVIFYDE